jgi:hypothetical protein
MYMKSALRMAVATGLLTTVSVSAFAVSMTPPNSGPVNLPQSGNGGLEVQIFTTSASITAWLGPNFNDFLPGGTDANETIDFGTIGGAEFNTLFGGAAAGTVKFNVSAANGLTSGSNSLLTTVSAGANNSLVTNGVIAGSISALNTSIGSVANQTNTSPGAPNFTDMCNSGTNPCVGPTLGSSGYGFIAKSGDTYGGQMPFSASGSAGGGSLAMFQFTQNGTKLNPPTIANFAGVWALSSTGDLTYTAGSAVPLPAAAWLLGSGLLGLAGIARRRSAAAAAA